MGNEASLRAVVIHTIAWALLRGLYPRIPVVTWQGNFIRVGLLAGIVLVEITVLIVNGFRCPLTNVAAHYTTDRRDNFDIYLPLWIARYSKMVFGWLFVAGLLFARSLAALVMKIPSA